MISKLGKLIKKLNLVPVMKRLAEIAGSVFGVVLFILISAFPGMNIVFIADMVDEYGVDPKHRKIFKGFKDDDEFVGAMAISILIAAASYFSLIKLLISS